MVTCYSAEEVRAAALADHDDPAQPAGGPQTQEEADATALILAPYQDKPAAA